MRVASAYFRRLCSKLCVACSAIDSRRRSKCPRPPRHRHLVVSDDAPGCGRLSANDGRGGRDRQCLRRTSRTHDPVRCGHVGRRSRAGDRGRSLLRPEPDESHHRGQRERPRREGGGRRHAQAAQCLSARLPRTVLPDRSGRRRHARRHGIDPRVRNQCSALRHDARKRARHNRRLPMAASSPPADGRASPPPATT